MRYLILICVLFLSLMAVGQRTLVTDKIRIDGQTIDRVVTDTTLNEATNQQIVTAKVIKSYVDNSINNVGDVEPNQISNTGAVVDDVLKFNGTDYEPSRVGYEEIENNPWILSGGNIYSLGKVGFGLSPLADIHLRKNKSLFLIDTDIRTYSGPLLTNANVRQIIQSRSVDFLTYLNGDKISIRNNLISGGFARSLLQFENSAGNAYFAIGSRGGGQDLQYNFMGRGFQFPFLKWTSTDRVVFHDLSSGNPDLSGFYVKYEKSVLFKDTVQIDNKLNIGATTGNVYLESQSLGELSLFCNAVRKMRMDLLYTHFADDITIGFDGVASSKLHVLQGLTGKALSVAMLGNRTNAIDFVEGTISYFTVSTSIGEKSITMGHIGQNVRTKILADLVLSRDTEVKANGNATGVLHDGSFVYQRRNAHQLFSNNSTATTLHLEFSDQVEVTSKGLMFYVSGLMDDSPWQGKYYIKYNDGAKTITPFLNNEEPAGFTILAYEATSGNIAVKITKTGFIGNTSTPVHVQRAFDIDSANLPDIVNAAFNTGANL